MKVHTWYNWHFPAYTRFLSVWFNVRATKDFCWFHTSYIEYCAMLYAYITSDHNQSGHDGWESFTSLLVDLHCAVRLSLTIYVHWEDLTVLCVQRKHRLQLFKSLKPSSPQHETFQFHLDTRSFVLCFGTWKEKQHPTPCLPIRCHEPRPSRTSHPELMTLTSN